MVKKVKASKPVFLTIEDEESFEGGLPDAIVPVVFSSSKRRLEGECYFGAYPALRGFLAQNAQKEKNLFSKESLARLNAALKPYLDGLGYVRMGGIYRFYRSFVLWDLNKLNTTAILPSSILLTDQTRRQVKINRTDFDLDELLAKRLPTVITVENGELVSVASVNEHGSRQRLLEISVYTRPRFRSRGFGRSNTALLAKLLLEDKKGAVYVCSSNNRPSIRIARSLGFEGDSCFYAVDAYKLER